MSDFDYPTGPIPVVRSESLPAPKPSMLYLANLIAALVASVGIVIGSSGPWVSVLVFGATGTNGDGKITLALGLISAAVLSVVSFGKMRALGCILAVTAGVFAFATGLFSAAHITSQEKVDFFGTTIGAQIGWGLWLVLITSLTLIVTASVVVRQAPR